MSFKPKLGAPTKLLIEPADFDAATAAVRSTYSNRLGPDSTLKVGDVDEALRALLDSAAVSSIPRNFKTADMRYKAVERHAGPVKLSLSEVMRNNMTEGLKQYWEEAFSKVNWAEIYK